MDAHSNCAPRGNTTTDTLRWIISTAPEIFLLLLFG
jgi:hypothetical protein